MEIDFSGLPDEEEPLEIDLSGLPDQGGDNRTLVYQSLQDYGASPAATAAILGDIEQESSFRARLPGDGGTSWGLLQVGKPMFNQFEAAAAEAGLTPDDPDYVYNQVPFILDSFKRQHPDRWEAMQNASNAGEALEVFRGTKDWGYGIEGKRFKYAAEIEREITPSGLIAGEPTDEAIQIASLPQVDLSGLPDQEEAEPRAVPVKPYEATTEVPPEQSSERFAKHVRQLVADTPVGQPEIDLSGLPDQAPAPVAPEGYMPKGMTPAEEQQAVVGSGGVVAGVGDTLMHVRKPIVPQEPEEGTFLEGLDIASIPKDVLLSLTPASEAPRVIKQAYKILTGTPIAEAIPESQELVGIEKKSVVKRVEAAAKKLIEIAFMKAAGKQAFPKARSVVKTPIKEPKPPVEEPALPETQYASVIPEFVPGVEKTSFTTYGREPIPGLQIAREGTPETARVAPEPAAARPGQGEPVAPEPSAEAPGKPMFGFGPGAAAAGERLAVYEQRAFAEKLVEDQRLTKELQENVGNRYYEPIPNNITADQAAGLVAERPITDVLNAVRDEQSTLPFHIRSTMGQLAIQRLNKAHRTLTEAGDTKAAETALNQAIDMAEWQAEFGTRLGQGVQSFAMWQRLTPEGKLVGIQRYVKKARDKYTSIHPGEIEQIKQTLLLQGRTSVERLFDLRKLTKTNRTAKKIKPLLTRLVESAREIRKQPELFDDIFWDTASDRLGLPKYNHEMAAEIMRLAYEIDKAPDGMPKDSATIELQRFIAGKMGFAPNDLPVGIYYGNMLSGYNTQAVNFLDTLLNVTSEVNGLALVNPRAAAKIWAGTLRGFNEGRSDAWLAWTKGRMLTNSRWLDVPDLLEVARFGEKGGVPLKTDTAKGRALKAVFESPIAKPFNAWKYVRRMMSASDSVMYRGAKEGRSALMAWRAANQEGLRGRALDRRVRELLGRTEEQAEAFRAQAESEGFTGAAATARMSELREGVRSKESNADANDFAGVATYNHDPQGYLGHIATSVDKALRPTPLIRAVVVPFTRIVANVTNRGLNYTPWGFKRALKGYHGDEGLPTSDARAAMMTRATLGTAALTTLGVLHSQGVIEINGAGPNEPERKKQLQEAGWKPYSIKIGDKYFSYIYTPVGLGLSVLGNIFDSYRYGNDEKGALTRGMYALSRIGSTIFSQSFLSGLSNVFGALSSGPGEAVASARRIFQSTVGTATTPTIIRDLYRLFDPNRYDSNTLMGDMLKNTPFASVANKPTLNAFGEPVRYPSNRFISTVTKDHAWDIVTRSGLRVSVPGKDLEMPDGRGGQRQITPEEYYQLLSESGPRIKEFVLRNSIAFTLGDKELGQKRLSSEAEKIRKGIIERLRRQAQFNPID